MENKWTGANVSFKSPGSPFINTNLYDIFEIPKRENKQFKSTGNFLIIAHDLHCNLWIISYLKYYINYKDSIGTEIISDCAVFRPLGSYEVMDNNGIYSLLKKDSINSICYERHYRKGFFDNYHDRKKAYGETRAVILNKLNRKKKKYSDNLDIKGSEIVKRYNKPRRKPKHRKFY